MKKDVFKELIWCIVHSMISVFLAVIAILNAQSSHGLPLTFLATLSAVIALSKAGIKLVPYPLMMVLIHIAFSLFILFILEPSKATYGYSVWIGGGFSISVLLVGLLIRIAQLKSRNIGHSKIASISAILLVALFGSCSKTEQKQDDVPIKNSMNLVEILDTDHDVDVFGDPLKPNNHYVFTNQFLFVPVATIGTLPLGKISIQEYLSSLKSMGNLKSDTVMNSHKNNGPRTSFILFEIKNIRIAPIAIQ